MNNKSKIRKALQSEMERVGLDDDTPMYISVKGIPLKQLSDKDIESFIRFCMGYNHYIHTIGGKEEKLVRIPVELINEEYLIEIVMDNKL